MARKRPRRTPDTDGNLTVPRMIRFAPEDVAAQNRAAERDGRPWANWARRVLAEAAARAALSPAARAAKAPVSPEALTGALHDRVHQDLGPSRPARSVKVDR